jgi:hypothetical protein
MDRFLVACGGSRRKALDLYRYNLAISKAFYPVLNLFELFLRNNVNAVLTDYFGDSEWVIKQKTGFMNDPRLSSTRFFLRESVLKAEPRLKRQGLGLTSQNILPELAFGFWCSLFEHVYNPFLKGSVMRCFPRRPAYADRESVAGILIEIRDFRNKIYHNEPICLNSRGLSLCRAERVHSGITKLLEWMDGELREYVQYHDEVLERIASARGMMNDGCNVRNYKIGGRDTRDRA